MSTNQPLWPTRWLMTDERLDEQLEDTIERLPPGSGIVFRHYGLDDAERLKLGLGLARQARDRSLLLAVAGSRSLAQLLGAKLVHNADGPGELPASMAVHDEAQARAAKAAGAALVFIGPVYATRSHPDRPELGIDRAVELAELAACPAIALGGMNEQRFAALRERGFHGYAGIDCWLRI
jgi:thiamine-phosphate pyrophosphorylase